MQGLCLTNCNDQPSLTQVLALLDTSYIICQQPVENLCCLGFQEVSNCAFYLLNPTHVHRLDCSGMADITVKIFKGQEEIASELISSPATAAEIKAALIDTKAEWVGKLTEPDSRTGIVGHSQLMPGETYHLHLQQRAGQYYNTAPAHVMPTNILSGRGYLLSLRVCQLRFPPVHYIEMP